jgi:hypothetical protein
MTRTATPALLAAPTLPQALRHGINAVAAAHLQVDIAPYPGMDEGDLIELFWNNCYVASRRVTSADIGTPTPARAGELCAGRPARVHYQVMQIGHGPARSASTRCASRPTAPAGDLRTCTPTKTRTSPRQPARDDPPLWHQQPSGATGYSLTIEPYLNMAKGDAITLRWGDGAWTCRKSRPRVSARPCRSGCRRR